VAASNNSNLRSAIIFQPGAHYDPGEDSYTKRDNSNEHVLSYPGKGERLLTCQPAKSAAAKDPTGMQAN
jgi:hypothetical protein